jgi:tetratricopeptide (TPR) repeat protein
MGRRARWGMVIAALVLAASSSAKADDDRANREAEARFKEGLARVKSKDFEAARLSFEQAYAVLHRPLILWNLALSEEKTSHPLEALGHFRQVAREAPSDADRASAQRHVDALLGEFSRIDVQAPAGTVLALDGGGVAGTAPLADPLDVMPGHHVVAATLAGGVAKSSEVEAVAGQVAHVSFVADPPAPVVAAMPAAAPVAATPAPAPAATDLPPPPDESTRRFWTPRTVSATVFAGAAVVVGGAAAAFGIASQNNKSAVTGYKGKYPSDYCFPAAGKAAPSDCGPWNDAVNAQNRDADISNALYFAAGALALGAVVSWFFWPKPGHTKAAWVLPEVGPQGAGVEAGGRF